MRNVRCPARFLFSAPYQIRFVSVRVCLCLPVVSLCRCVCLCICSCPGKLCRQVCCNVCFVKCHLSFSTVRFSVSFSCVCVCYFPPPCFSRFHSNQEELVNEIVKCEWEGRREVLVEDRLHKRFIGELLTAHARKTMPKSVEDLVARCERN